MMWRRSNRRPKWFKAVRKLDDAGCRKCFKPVKLEGFKTKGSSHIYSYKKLEIDEKILSRLKELKPLLDIFNEEDRIVIVAELKGFKGENIKVNVEKQRLILSAKSQNRRYCKRLNLPDTVIPESMHTTYKNGVLEIRLKKAVEKSAISKPVG